MPFTDQTVLTIGEHMATVTRKNVFGSGKTLKSNCVFLVNGRLSQRKRKQVRVASKESSFCQSNGP